MRAVLAFACLVAALCAPAAHALPFDGDAIDDCLEATPHAINVPFGDPIEVRVMVLLDGVSEGQAAAMMVRERVSYEPLGIDLTVAGFQEVSFTGDDSRGLIDQSKQHFGGKRPWNAHLVYTFTSKDMVGGALGGAVAGQADCIGGIAFDDGAFAVGELHPSQGDDDVPAKIGAHELGHLLGAHHQYANCAEGVPDDDLAPCTLMFNDVGLASLGFSTLNASIVRGHAEQFAKPLVEPVAASEPAPTATPAPSATPAPTASATPAREEGAQPGAASGPEPARTDTRGELCGAAKRLLARTRAAEAKARRATSRARTRAARRRATARLRDRVAARRAAQRSVRAHCR